MKLIKYSFNSDIELNVEINNDINLLWIYSDHLSLELLSRLNLSANCGSRTVFCAISWNSKNIVTNWVLCVGIHDKILCFISRDINSPWCPSLILLCIVVNLSMISPLIEHLTTEVFLSNIRKWLNPSRVLHQTSWSPITTSTTFLLFWENNPKISLCDQLSTGGLYTRHYRTANGFVLTVLECNSLVTVWVIVPMLSNSVNPSSNCVVLYELLRPYIWPERRVDWKTKNQQSD